MKNLFLLFFFLLFAININAQKDNINNTDVSSSLEKPDPYFTFSFGATFPSGDFGEYDFDRERKLGASTGVGINFEYTYPISNSGFGLFFSAGLNLNWVKGEFKEAFEDESNIDIDDITFQKFLNLPISSGVNYTINADEKLGFILNFGLLANTIKITDFVIDTEDYEIIYSTKPKTNIGIKMGAGLLINDKTLISLNYYDAGRTPIRYTYEQSYDGDTYKDSETITSKISYLSLTVGFKL